MPTSSSCESMFPRYDFNSSAYEEQCWNDFGVKPRPRWITTEFGGHVGEQIHMLLPLQSCFPFPSKEPGMLIISFSTIFGIKMKKEMKRNKMEEHWTLLVCREKKWNNILNCLSAPDRV